MTAPSRAQISDRHALDENLSYATTNTTTEAALPVDFISAVATTVTSRTIPGGALGANGFLEIVGYCAYSVSSTTAVSVTMSVSATSQTVTTASFGTGAAFGLEIRGVVQNSNSEQSQVVHLSILSARSNGTSDGQTRLTSFGTYADTSVDWTFGLSILSGTGATLAKVDTVRITTQSIP